MAPGAVLASRAPRLLGGHLRFPLKATAAWLASPVLSQPVLPVWPLLQASVHVGHPLNLPETPSPPPGSPPAAPPRLSDAALPWECSLAVDCPSPALTPNPPPHVRCSPRAAPVPRTPSPFAECCRGAPRSPGLQEPRSLSPGWRGRDRSASPISFVPGTTFQTACLCHCGSWVSSAPRTQWPHSPAPSTRSEDRALF